MLEKLFILAAGVAIGWAFWSGAVGCSSIQNGVACQYNARAAEQALGPRGREPTPLQRWAP